MTRTRGYLFISDELDDQAAYPLVFTDENNHATGMAESYRLSELKDIVGDCPLTVLIPDRLTAFHHATLPLLSDKKAQAAIPYALEDFSAQEVKELHFSYDRNFYDNGQYLVLSCDKSWLQALITLLKKHGIEAQHLTTAWFALTNNQGAIHNQTILCRSDEVNGAIPFSMWPMVRSQLTSDSDIRFVQFGAADNLPESINKALTQSDHPWETWVVEHLANTTFISLNQGQFKTQSEQKSLKLSILLASASLAIWLVVWLSTNLLSLHHTNNALDEVDKKIAVIYRQFFPGAKQVISPKFRISQKLKAGGMGGESNLVLLLDKLIGPLQSNQITPIQISYQNQRMTLKLIANDFSQLERFLTTLKQQSVKAKQIDANRNDNKVEATVEMQL